MVEDPRGYVTGHQEGKHNQPTATHPVHSGQLDRCDELLRPSRRVMKPGGSSRGFARRAADGVGVAEPYATRTALGKSPPQRSKRRDRQLRQAQLRAPGLQQALSPAGMASRRIENPTLPMIGLPQGPMPGALGDRNPYWLVVRTEMIG